MIPKTIYYAWFGGKSKPVEITKRIEQWQRLNPDYLIVEINEQNFDVQMMAYTATAYAEGKWAFVSDVARLVVIYQNGGFYFDTDVDLLKPLDSLRENKLFFAKESPSVVASGLGFGGESNNRLLEYLIKIYESSHFDSETSFLTTDVITSELKKIGLSDYNALQVLPGDVTIYPTNYFAPLHFFGGGKIRSYSIAVHRYEGSWISKKLNIADKVRMQLILRLNFYLPFIRVMKNKIKNIAINSR